MEWLITLITLVFFSTNTEAEQLGVKDFDSAKNLFWETLYPESGWTLYCGEYFNSKTGIAIEHIYPMSWVIKHLACDNQENCRTQTGQYQHIESDLHNMYPILETMDNVRKDYQFGIIAEEYREFFECDFEREATVNIVEPRPLARGNIARAIFYVRDKYNLPVDIETIKLLIQWHLNDPPSKDEIRRNNIIESLQGTRNKYIDNPDAVHKLNSAEENKEVY